MIFVMRKYLVIVFFLFVLVILGRFKNWYPFNGVNILSFFPCSVFEKIKEAA